MVGTINSFLINKGGKDKLTKRQVGSLQNSKNVQEPSKTEVARYGKTDSRYWKPRLFKNTYTVKGERRETPDWCMKVEHERTRKTVNLRTPNIFTAASKAATFYKNLQAGGWAFALGKLRPETLKAKPLSVTVGDLIDAATRLSTVRPETLDAYSKALRRLTAGVMGIKDGQKYSKGEGNAVWRSKVDSVELEKLTPSAVHAWKNTLLKEAKTIQHKRHAATTFNSILRNSKSLVSKKIKRFVAEQLTLPSPLWFEGVTMEPEPSLRYRSRIDAPKLIKAAKEELAAQQPELFKLFLLTFSCGLRRSEADALLWDQIDLKNGKIFIHDTEEKRLKTSDSEGEIALDSELIPFFEEALKKATGPFVLEATKTARSQTAKRKSRGYRCNASQTAFLKWLRANGVSALKPMHTLRKEIGAIIATRSGIYAASGYLRHSGIQITAKLYADNKEPVRAGIGHYFA